MLTAKFKQPSKRFHNVVGKSSMNLMSTVLIVTTGVYIWTCTFRKRNCLNVVNETAIPLNVSSINFNPINWDAQNLLHGTLPSIWQKQITGQYVRCWLGIFCMPKKSREVQNELGTVNRNSPVMQRLLLRLWRCLNIMLKSYHDMTELVLIHFKLDIFLNLVLRLCFCHWPNTTKTTIIAQRQMITKLQMLCCCWKNHTWTY